MINYEGKYKDFFDIDENYFPCIDDSALNNGVEWVDTYPHKAFIDLLKGAERMLSGTTKRSLWIHGAYGTGKSKCAYALRKILEVPENELTDYWNEYDNLKNNPDLLTKISGHKERGVLTCYRYASGGITTPKQLFFSIQETVKKALEEKGLDLGVGSLKESVIEWLSDEDNRHYFNTFLRKPKWASLFTQSSADEVLAALNSGRDIKDLMDNIFELADDVGIRVMNLDADKLKAWLKDVINRNNKLKIVFIWDEFSGFFKQNKNSLDEFQKVVSLCEEAPFYLVVVTHQTGSLMNEDDQSWQVVKQRFEFSEITLPSNIAFELIGHAFHVKKASEETWNLLADSLNSGLSSSRAEVMKAAQITDPKVIKKIMPLHPMAALVLKNIAVSFQSNQRSMFDFIKTNSNDDVHAFQWFINERGPLDTHPLLTIDLLWNFFYEHGKDNLSSDIRMILDTFNQQKNLREDEQTVLKTILIMQAIDKRLGGEIDVLKPTEKNISLAFEGISDYDGQRCVNIAKTLKNKGILVLTPIGNNVFAYGAAVLAGDQSEIDKSKNDIKKNAKTFALVNEGELKTVLGLNSPLRLRFAEDVNDGSLIPVTNIDFTRVMNGLKTRTSPWHFTAVIAFAKDSEEAASFRRTLKEAALNDDYKNIIIIDALSTPLDSADFDEYVEHSAMAAYYNSRNRQSAEEYNRKAKAKLSVGWKNRIYNGQFIVYHEGNRAGEIAANGSAVAGILQRIVLAKFPYVFDFNRGVTENQLKLTQAKVAAKCALDGKTSGIMVNAERFVLSAVWSVENYWLNPALSSLPISIIKNDIESLIQANFAESGSGRIGIEEVYGCLERKYGFAPCNLTAFICAFLLKDYSLDPYRYLDERGMSGSIDHEKLSEMIKNCMDIKKPTNSFIVKMTPEEMSFYSLTRQAWNISAESISSPEQASIFVKQQIQRLKLPIWSLEYADSYGVYDVVKKYIELIQHEGAEAHKIAVEIGTIAIRKPTIADTLSALLTQENCQIGMKNFLSYRNDGELMRLAEQIGAKDTVVNDVANLFSVEYSSLWKKETGEEQIDNLVTDYTFVKLTNELLNVNANSRSLAMDRWCETLKFLTCSAEGLIAFKPELKEVWEFLLKIYQRNEILPAQMKGYTIALAANKTVVKDCLNNETNIFVEMYGPYLEEVSLEDIRALKPSLIGMFKEPKTVANGRVKQVVEDYLSEQVKAKLFNLWKEKTGTKSPVDWSCKNRTPILRMVKRDEYDDAKKAFETLNRGNGTEIEINNALEYLQRTTLFEVINSQEAIDNAFSTLLGKYKVILSDYNKVRDVLDRLAIDAYEWDTHPRIRQKINDMVKAEYDAGGSDKAISKIETMNVEDLKKYLIELVRDKVDLGLEILNGGK